MNKPQPSPDKGNVERPKHSDMGDAAAQDFISELASDPTAKQPEGEPEKGKKEGEDVPKKPADEPAKEEKKDPEKPKEGEELNKPKPEEEKPFATIGSQNFKNLDELLHFAETQSGYNRWLTGTVKKAFPEWFDEDGKLLPGKVKRVEAIKEEAKDAAEKLKEGKELTDAEKESLRKAGIVLKEDLDKILEERGLEATSTELDEFDKKYPKASAYYDELSDLMELENKKPEDLRQSLEEVWLDYSKRRGIKNEEPAKTDDTEKNKEKKSGLDNLIPSPPAKKDGAAPKESQKDPMDEIMGAGGI